MSRVKRVLVSVVALGVAVAVASGCTVPRPEGDGVVRYRDEITTKVKVTKDLTYSQSQDGVANPLRLDLYEPQGDTVAKRPALVWVHGGGFTSGDKSGGGLATKFARLGYVAVSIDYRLLRTSDQGCAASGATPECVAAVLAAQHDAQAAVRWLRANAATYGIDPNRIAVSGGSAGGATALMVATHSEDPGDSGNPGQSSKVQGAVVVNGAITPEIVGEYFNSGDPPTIFFHGTADAVVPYQWAVSDTQAMLDRGIAANLVTFDGLGHGLLQQPVARPAIEEQSDYWLYYALDLKNAER